MDQEEPAYSELTVYTDGACVPNPGTGGWAYVVVAEGLEVGSCSGRDENVTNNQMELMAAIRGAEEVCGMEIPVTLVTDSQYVAKAFTEGWIDSWQRRGWTTATGEPVKNIDLWRRLANAVHSKPGSPLTFRWVRGHVGNEFNERCDQLAVQARKQGSERPGQPEAADGQKKRPTTIEKTLLIVKPDAVKRGLVGKVVSRIEDKGLKITGMRMMKFSRAMAERHYAEHKDQPFFRPLCKFICQGPSIVLRVEGENAVFATRGLMGSTKGAPPGTIRGDFAASTMENLVHGSDSPKKALEELEMFFP